MNRLKIIGLFAVMALFSVTFVTFAQDDDDASTFTRPPADSPVWTSAWQRIGLFAGPGIRHPQPGYLNAGVPVTIMERNRIGNWARVMAWSNTEPSEPTIDGWVLSGFLNHHEDLDYGAVPVVDLPDADPALAYLYTDQTERKLSETPILTPISAAMEAVFADGQAQGNDPAAFLKIGDSLSADPTYLDVFALEDPILGPYRYLQPTLDWFGASAGESVTAQIGMTTYTVFDPMWADAETCEAGETPLDCAFREKRPSVAFIMFGQNDMRHMTYEQFEAQISMIVEYALERGTIPVLMTFSLHPDDPFNPQGMAFNSRLVDVAAAYEVPLINLWAASRVLPGYGLDVDNVHLNRSGFSTLRLDNGVESRFGVSLANLLALVTLDELRIALGMDGE